MTRNNNDRNLGGRWGRWALAFIFTVAIAGPGDLLDSVGGLIGFNSPASTEPVDQQAINAAAIARVLDEGPTRRYRDPAGRIVWEWQSDSVKHREDGPAHIERNAQSGIIVHEEWWSNGQRHRTDGGPALVLRDSLTGQILFEEWWLNGKRHRDDGPAAIRRDGPTGHVIHEEWWRDGERVPHRIVASANIQPDAAVTAYGMPMGRTQSSSTIARVLDEGPTRRYRDHVGRIIWEWRDEDQRNRDGAPAVVEYSATGLPPLSSATPHLSGPTG
jgi:hypothetical protein